MYVVRPHGEQRVAGYYALAAGAVQREDASPRLQRGLGQHPIPVVVLTRLGVDGRDQRLGLGAELVRDTFLQAASVAERIGVRALLIHAEVPRATSFYRGLDPAFEPMPGEPLHLVLLIKDLRKAIGAPLLPSGHG